LVEPTSQALRSHRQWNRPSRNSNLALPPSGSSGMEGPMLTAEERVELEVPKKQGAGIRGAGALGPKMIEQAHLAIGQTT
jgi:hypothetical protein